MAHANRRNFLVLSAALASGLPARPGQAAGPQNPEPRHFDPRHAGATSLADAFRRRRSTRTYSEESVDPGVLDTLLWCAMGVNRPESGGRTAPSWHTSYGTDIYVADARSVRRYDPMAASLQTVLEEDVRRKASPQPFVATAPLVLVYVADLSRMYEASYDERVQAAHVDAGIVAQNVYLYCASVELGTCLVGGVDKAALGEVLKLPETQMVTFAQPVGHPRPAT